MSAPILAAGISPQSRGAWGTPGVSRAGLDVASGLCCWTKVGLDELGELSNPNNPRIPQIWCVPMDLCLKLLPKSEFFSGFYVFKQKTWPSGAVAQAKGHVVTLSLLIFLAAEQFWGLAVAAFEWLWHQSWNCSLSLPPICVLFSCQLEKTLIMEPVWSPPQITSCARGVKSSPKKCNWS